MFCSPCSLRSPACAALIALAAAAGISRFEPVSATPVAPEPTTTALASAAGTLARMQIFLTAFQTLASHPCIAHTTVDHRGGEPLEGLALAPDDPWPPAPPVTEAPVNFFAWTAAMPAVRQHSYPYAVGPPRRGTRQKLRAAGTEVPGDSSARRSPLSRIARVFIALFGAHVIRTADAGPQLAASKLQPGSALRGEPGFHRSQTPCVAAHVLVARAHFSP